MVVEANKSLYCVHDTSNMVSIDESYLPSRR